MHAAARRTLAAAATGAAATGLAWSLPVDRAAFDSPAAHTVLETSVALVAGLVGLLLYGRYRRTASLRDLLLVYAMAIFALGTSALLVVPAVLDTGTSDVTTTWAVVLARLLASLLVLAASLISPAATHRVAHPTREAVLVAGLVIGMVALTFAFSAALPDLVELPRRVSPVDSGSRADQPLVLATQAVHVCCYAVAAVRLTLGAWRQDDELLGWLGAAAALGAFSRLNYVFLPTTYTTWVSTGDLLLLGFVVLLLVGAVREIRCFWVTTAAAAAEVERRRLARDLHDGLLQELGYIRTEARRSLSGHDTLDRIAAAADRGLDEARRSMQALVGLRGESLADALERSIKDLAQRYGVTVRLELAQQLSVPTDDREQPCGSRGRRSRTRCATRPRRRCPSRSAMASSSSPTTASASTRPSGVPAGSASPRCGNGPSRSAHTCGSSPGPKALWSG